MKTFEVYSLYDTAYRGRVLIATVQADRFVTTHGSIITFYKDTFFSSKPISEVAMGGAFAVLDTEFSISLPGENVKTPQSNQALNTFLAGAGTPVQTKKRSKKSNSDSLLKLDE